MYLTRSRSRQVLRALRKSVTAKYSTSSVRSSPPNPPPEPNNRSIISWSAIQDESPNKNCPLQKVGKHYILRDDAVLPQTRGLDYVDSDIIFMNYHEDGFGVCISSDKDLCKEKNYDLDNRILHYYMPRLPFREFDHSAVDQMLDFWDNEYVFSQRLKDVYGDQTYKFLRNQARIIALQPYLSLERKKAYYLQFGMIFTFDDIAEHLTTLDDPSLLHQFRKNTISVLKGRDEKPIDFSQIPNFPEEYIEKSKLQHQLQSDISRRLLQHGGPHVQRAYSDAFGYYNHGVDVGRDMVRRMREGHANLYYTHSDYLLGRCHSAGGVVVASASMSNEDAEFFSPQDALVSIVDLGMVTEADFTSYHREKSYDKYYGKLVTVNCLDYPILVNKKSIMKAARESIIMHNDIIDIMVRLLPLVPAAQRQRYAKCLDNILIVNDYSFYTGTNDINTRYGWYPIRKQDAVFNLEKYKDDQKIGISADADLMRR